MADHWVHYDAEGNRVSPAQARFLGKEVEIGVGGSTRPGNDPLRRYRYTDVHAIGSSERHTFEAAARLTIPPPFDSNGWVKVEQPTASLRPTIGSILGGADEPQLEGFAQST
jgi:hypothetical protein